MSMPVNCGTSFCSCIECVVPLRTMTREELDTEIVVAISVFKAAKREELVQAVEDAEDANYTAHAAYIAFGSNNFHADACAACAAWDAAYAAWVAALVALDAYDKESNDSFHNFAECLCESYQREELVKAVYEARVSWDYSNRDAYADHWKRYHEATAALKAYDKEKNT